MKAESTTDTTTSRVNSRKGLSCHGMEQPGCCVDNTRRVDARNHDEQTKQQQQGVAVQLAQHMRQRLC